MTKKDYVAFARMLRRLESQPLQYEDIMLLGEVRQEIMDIFEQDNPRFDRERFIDTITTGKGL